MQIRCCIYIHFTSHIFMYIKNQVPTMILNLLNKNQCSDSHDTYIPTFIWYIFSTIIVSTTNIHYYNYILMASVFQHCSLIINNRICSLFRDWFEYHKNTTSSQIYKNKVLSNLKAASNVTTIYIHSLILTCITGKLFFTSITFLLQIILITESGDLFLVR